MKWQIFMVKDARFKIIGEGFTLIEIIVTLSIAAVIFTLATFVSMDLYRGNSLDGQRDMLVGILQRARGQAMNNINQSPHGVHMSGNGYTLFQGLDWQDRLSVLDINFPPDAASFFGISDVVFNQLSGSSGTVGDIVISQNNKQLTVSINSQGQIAW